MERVARARPPLARFINLAGDCLLLVLGAVYVLFDRLAAVSLNPVLLAILCSLGAACGALLAHARPPPFKLAIPLLVVLLMLAVQWVDWDSRKPFLRAFHRIEPGMSVDQVDRLMAGSIRSPDGAGLVLPSGAVGYRHTRAGWGDGDVGLVTFADGRVTTREFFPD